MTREQPQLARKVGLEALVRQSPEIMLCAGLLLLILVPCLRFTRDSDIFFHLRTGDMIWAHRALPSIDTFSRAGLEHGRPWLEYTWLFDVFLHLLYSAFGLTGTSIYTALMGTMIGLLLIGEVFSAKTPRPIAAFFLIACFLTLSPILSPRSWLFTILFLFIETKVLLSFRALNRPTVILPLIPLYILWASLHIQFVLGFALILLFAVERIVVGRFRDATLFITALCCALATMVNPYGWKVWSTVFQYASQSQLQQGIHETTPPDFGSVPEWTALVVFLSAGWVAVRSGRDRFLFSSMLLLGLLLFLRSRRDIWFLPIVASVVFNRGRAFGPTLKSACVLPKLAPAVVVASMCMLLAAGYGTRLSDRANWVVVKRTFPVEAAEFVRSHLGKSLEGATIRGPLYNSYNWGGFLMWALPELPVSIDGRTNVHGQERTLRHWATWEGERGWNEDPDLVSANLVILERTAPLVRLLRKGDGFKVVYEDSTGHPGAIVLARGGRP